MNKVLLGLKVMMSLAFGATAVGKFTQQAPILESFTRLGYPQYLTYMLAAAYVLGIIGIWQTVSPAIKQWAYAGFFFAITGALASHIAIGDEAPAIVMSAIFWLLVVASYALEQRH